MPTNKRAKNLWKRLHDSYGERFTSSYGPEPNESWINAIADISNDRLAYGVKKVMRDSPIHPPTLAQFTAACADMPAPKNLTGPVLQDQLAAYVVLNRIITAEQRRMPWTYCYREWEDHEKPKSLQRCCEVVSVIVPSCAHRDAFVVTVLDMLGDREGHERTLRSFQPGSRKFVPSSLPTNQ